MAVAGVVDLSGWNLGDEGVVLGDHLVVQLQEGFQGAGAPVLLQQQVDAHLEPVHDGNAILLRDLRGGL